MGCKGVSTQNYPTNNPTPSESHDNQEEAFMFDFRIHRIKKLTMRSLDGTTFQLPDVIGLIKTKTIFFKNYVHFKFHIMLYQIIYLFLSQLDLEFRLSLHTNQELIHDMFCLAREITNSSENIRLTVFPLRIEVTVVEHCLYDESHAYEMMLRQSLLQNQCRPLPADISVVEKLDKLQFKGDEKTTTCIVCLDEFELGMVITRLPCMHYYHHQCIVTWFNLSDYGMVIRSSLPMAKPQCVFFSVRIKSLTV